MDETRRFPWTWPPLCATVEYAATNATGNPFNAGTRPDQSEPTNGADQTDATARPNQPAAAATLVTMRSCLLHSNRRQPDDFVGCAGEFD